MNVPSRGLIHILRAGRAWGRLGQSRREKGGLLGSLDCSLNLLPKLLTEMGGGWGGGWRERGGGRERKRERERENMNVS